MSTRSLKLATGLTLPLDAATQTFAFIARKGAGKTYAAGKLVELLLAVHVQVVVLDTVGNWYGLRLSADGKGRGFDVPVLGGLRGDIPLEAAGGALIADIVADTGRSMVLDASQFSKADRQRFAAAFGERLWMRKKAERHASPVHLVIEESQLIVPQDVRGDVANMVGVYEEIIRLGRNYGIGVSMITQRPQSVNKEVLNQTECLLVGQVNGAQERDALKKWITHQGMDVHLVDELPSLKVGTFYVWSPQWLQILKRVEILPKQTFDASATPKVGDRRVRRELKPLDLEDLQAQLKATIEKAKADDPRELRKQLAAARAELANKEKVLAEVDERTKRIDAKLHAKTQVADRAAVKTANAELKAELVKYRRALGEAMKILVKVKAVDFAVDSEDGRKALEQAVAAAVKQVTATIEKRVTGLATRIEGFKKDAAAAEKAITALLDEKIDLTVTVQKAEPFTVVAPKQPRAPRAQREQSDQTPIDGLTEPQRRILDVVAMLHQRGITPDRECVAAWLDIHPRGGSYGENIGALRAGGYLDGWTVTESGAAIARDIPTGLEAAMEPLTEPQRRILQLVINSNVVYNRDSAAKALGLHPRGGSYGENIGRLRTMGLLEPRGEFKVTEAVFR
jgi:uncharacterized protein